MNGLVGAARGAVPVDDVACDHCSLPVPTAFLDHESERQFCCHGCRAVYEAIHDYGLQRFYDMQEPEDAGVQANPRGGDFEAFDHEAFEELYVQRSDGDTCSVELYLQGIHCSACVWLIEKLPEVQSGVISTRVDIGRQTARIEWDAHRAPLSRIARLLDRLGYTPRAYRSSEVQGLRREEDRRMLVRLAVAGAIAGNVMIISFALFGGMLAPMEPQYRSLFRGSSLALMLLALLWPGRVFLVGALSSLRTRTMHMDLPVAIALVSGTAWGASNTLRGVGETYFESLTAVIFLLLVGRFVLHRRQRSAQDALEMLFSLTPQEARLIEPGGIRTVPVEALQPGVHVEVRAGDSVPADGRIVEGRSSFDFSLLTGESRPVDCAEGDRIFAGTTNVTGRTVVEVESTGPRTRVGRLMALVEQLSKNRPPIVRLADRVAHYFVIVVLTLAAATALFWMRHDPTAAIENAIALLIVTCPCALGLATPLALVASIGHAARRGILIKGGETLESLARPGLLLLDKTGTLTQGRTELIFWKGDDAVRPWIAAIERQVAHPIANAFVEAFADDSAPADVVVRQTPGNGVTAQADGREWHIGSPFFVGARVDTVPDWAAEAEQACLEQALSPVWIAAGGQIVAVAGFGDPLHDDAERSVRALERRGWKLGVLSGDHPAVVRAVAGRLGLTSGRIEGAVPPERKAEIVQEELGRGGTVVMTGDGVNDTAALSAATVGIAVHGGAEASLAAADVFLGRPGLGPLVELIEGANRTVGVIRRNIAISVLYNVFAGSLAMAGAIDPLIAALLMPISSLSVVTLSYRARTFSG